MSIFEWLKNSASERRVGEGSSSTAVRDIARRLSDLDPDRARWIAAFALVLARAARADLDISSEELRAMQDIVQEIGGLPEDQAALVAEMASHRNELLGVTEDYLSTREFKMVAGEGDAERRVQADPADQSVIHRDRSVDLWQHRPVIVRLFMDAAVQVRFQTQQHAVGTYVNLRCIELCQPGRVVVNRRRAVRGRQPCVAARRRFR